MTSNHDFPSMMSSVFHMRGWQELHSQHITTLSHQQTGIHKLRVQPQFWMEIPFCTSRKMVLSCLNPSHPLQKCMEYKSHVQNPQHHSIACVDENWIPTSWIVIISTTICTCICMCVYIYNRERESYIFISYSIGELYQLMSQIFLCFFHGNFPLNLPFFICSNSRAFGFRAGRTPTLGPASKSTSWRAQFGT